MEPCRTPGTCAPYSGCQPSILKEVSVRYSSESGAQVVENPAVMPGLGQFVDYVWALKAERDTLLAQVATLQSDANSWQTGYDKGRNDGGRHMRSEAKRLTAQRDAILLQARTWACEAKSQQAITQEVSDALGGIPTWGPIAATVSARLAEHDAALELLCRCQEHLDPHRDAVLWGDLCAVLQVKP